MKFVVHEYLTADQRNPFRRWLEELDLKTRARIQARVMRFETGNLGDGVLEARLVFGPGYRVYFAIAAGTIVLLLLGGDKGSQTKDIASAKKYWTDFQEVAKHGKAK